MNAHDTALSIADALANSEQPALENVHIYAHDTEVLPDGVYQSPVEEIELPGIFIRVRVESLCGSETIGIAIAEIDVESQSDETSSETHAAREHALRTVMADQPALDAAFVKIKLTGKPCLVENEPETEERAFKTPYTYRLGVQEK